MTPGINVRAYRPRQVISVKEKSGKQSLSCMRLSSRQRRKLGVLVAAALVIGLGLTHFFHERIVALQVKVDQLQSSKTAIAAEMNRLAATGTQPASKAQVIALAKRKLKLYEPDPGQVRRM